MMHIEPTTTETMKDAAPTSSPIARLPDPARIAERVENKSGLPFPKARKVTPAMLSPRPKTSAMVARFGMKKSEAAMPIKENRNASQRVRPTGQVGVSERQLSKI
jgi:hypothetical protein